MPRYACVGGQCAAAVRVVEATSSLNPVLLDQLRDECRPTRLMDRAETRPIVTVKVLGEEWVVAEVRVRLELLRASKYRPSSLLITDKQAGQPSRQLCRDQTQREPVS